MLAIQETEIKWTKESRTPGGAAARRKALFPARLKNDLLSRTEQDNYFVNRRFFNQSSGKISSCANTGNFFGSAEKINIPSIKIKAEGKDYRIIWDSEHLIPLRRGRNEEWNDKSSCLCQRDILNVTAFILHENEAGYITFNTRVSGAYDCLPYYLLYGIYFVNTAQITERTFTGADYKYDFRQLARLF